MPVFSIVVPVYNRQDELRRALQSIAAQTMDDFQCIVVDDCSTRPVHSVVDEFDDRFTYVRRDENGGCTASRITGMTHAEGEFFTSLDSDNELYPWALDRATHYLREHPEVDGATGLYMFPDGPRIRIAGGVKVVGPDEYVTRSARSARADSVGTVRRNVVKEWLRLRPDYYNLDFILPLRFRLTHHVVLVDEPWGRYDTRATDKIAGRRDPRGFDDVLKFVEDFRPIVGTSPCAPIDVSLTNLWLRLLRGHRYRDAAVVADWMRERGISRHGALADKAKWRVRTRVARLIPARAHVL